VGFRFPRRGHTTLPAWREHLRDRVIAAEQGKSVSLPVRGTSIARRTDGGADIGNAKKRMLPGNRADRGCVAFSGQHHLAENGAHFALVLKLETTCGTDA